MSELFEMTMVILFGISWPINIVKAYKAKTAKGTSILFLACIFIGYLCGILSKPSPIKSLMFSSFTLSIFLWSVWISPFISGICILTNI